MCLCVCLNIELSCTYLLFLYSCFTHQSCLSFIEYRLSTRYMNTFVYLLCKLCFKYLSLYNFFNNTYLVKELLFTYLLSYTAVSKISCLGPIDYGLAPDIRMHLSIYCLSCALNTCHYFYINQINVITKFTCETLSCILH